LPRARRYHTGTFGLIYDKRQPWETDTHLPLYVRGPGIPRGSTVPALVTMPDLAATFLDMAGLPVPDTFDGTSWLPWAATGATAGDAAADADADADAAAGAGAGAPRATPPARLFSLVEYVGESSGGGDGAVCARTEGSPMFCGSDGVYRTPPYFNGSAVCVCQDATNNTYGCLRAHTPAGDNYRYCEFTDDARTVEFFNYTQDPYELVNAASSLLPDARSALSARLAAARSCAGAAACDALLAQPLDLAE